MFRWRDWLSGIASFALLFAMVSGTGCGTDAKAVDECRDIEQARCEAGASCNLVDDVDECKRFYRDHCLHGMVVESPGQSQIDACVATIKKAGACAATNVDATLADCPPDVSMSAATMLACDVVLYPENTVECDFLTPEPAATGGTGGTNAADPDAGDSFATVGGSDAGAGGATAAAGASN